MSNRTVEKLKIGAVLLALASLITACGSGDGDAALAGSDIGFTATAPCDSTLVLDSNDPIDAAKAMGICDGLVIAVWQLPDGTTTTNAKYSLGHGILPDFASSNPAREGEKLLALSSGTARRPSDPGYYRPTGPIPATNSGFEKNYTHGFPGTTNVLMPVYLPSCPQPISAHDGVALKVVLEVPVGVNGWALDYRYFTADYPNFNCTRYIDQAAAIITDSSLSNYYILRDSFGNYIFSDAYLGACTPTVGYPCHLGTASLVGTGYENHGATAWDTVIISAIEGDTVTINLMIWDSDDGNVDSIILFDNFRWLTL